ncbi:metallopeptidase family protein [Arachnia rubra]|uniref:Metallopeptidase family protein n=1 Tax=Arachnia rubra TaxID=1547448 RepID=A0ABX7Y343_9ACTN|nr:metallopeptidase family protein [Arachnia rubra]MBB1577468.1 metallopeptidase family protein [Propionibacterium sp.]MDO4644769.1 metallopeptidase family protein [Propionibacteriaceae bacterium]QUC07309.1 metallopeptidase family protein [Arachnia rubra]
MPRSRDRHDRGMHGTIALPDSNNRKAVPLHAPNRVEYFNQCVKEALAAIAEIDPRALDGTVVGVEDVPLLKTAWSGDRVPMSAALEPSKGRPAQIVIYERPLEHRASNRSALRALVHRTIVEQLSALTERPVRELLGYEPTDWED